jgi:hypothetical protein
MTAPVKITRTDHTPAGLHELAANSRDAAQTRRLLAIAMVLDGSNRAEAARQAGMDRQTLRDWVLRYNEAGADGLISRSAPGRQAVLTAAQMQELHDLVVAGPDPAVHHVVRWRCVDLRDEGGGTPLRCDGRRACDRQMVAQVEADPAAAASLSSEEGPGRRGGF